MLTRRQLLQLTALSTLGPVSTSVRAMDFEYWPIDLKSLEPIAHSVFGELPLGLSNQFQISYDERAKIQNSKMPDRKFDIHGVEIHIAENGQHVVPIVVRNIITTKLALVLERYGDQSPSTIAVYQFGELFGHEIGTRINCQGFSNEMKSLHRVWALAEGRGHVMCAYSNIRQYWSSDG